MAAIIVVCYFLALLKDQTQYELVHLEPKDKAKITEDVTSWILARAIASGQQHEGSENIQSKL